MTDGTENILWGRGDVRRDGKTW